MPFRQLLDPCTLPDRCRPPAKSCLNPQPPLCTDPPLRSSLWHPWAHGSCSPTSPAPYRCPTSSSCNAGSPFQGFIPPRERSLKFPLCNSLPPERRRTKESLLGLAAQRWEHRRSSPRQHSHLTAGEPSRLSSSDRADIPMAMSALTRHPSHGQRWHCNAWRLFTSQHQRCTDPLLSSCTRSVPATPAELQQSHNTHKCGFSQPDVLARNWVTLWVLPSIPLRMLLGYGCKEGR